MADGPKGFEKCPLIWIEQRDIESLSFERVTWIPLIQSEVILEHGESGTIGFRREYRNFESIVVPTEFNAEFK